MRFSRSELLIGKEGIRKLKNSHVAVFGLGGVGGYAAEALARSGIGEISVYDCDTVDITNINRQILALDSTIGELKTETAKSRIFGINPECRVNTCSELLTAENLSMFMTGFRYAVDAIDTVSAKAELISLLYSEEITFISSMGSANKFDPQEIRITDISKTFNCPLAKTVRKKLREKGIQKNVPVVFSPELRNPAGIVTDEKNEITGKRPQGTMSCIPPIFGFFAASFIIHKIIAD